MQSRAHVTSLGRSIDPRHPASAWVLFAASVVFVTSGLAHGWESGIRGAIAVVIAWAIVREIAPLRAIPSLLAPFTAVAFAIPAETDLLAGVGVLMAARITARSVGELPTKLDCVLLVPLAAWLATRPEAVPAALVLAAATAAADPLRRMRLTGFSMFIVVLVVGALEGSLVPVTSSWGERTTAGHVLIVSVAVAALVLMFVRLPDVLLARDDRDNGPLTGRRIHGARIIVVLSVLAGVLWLGIDAVFIMSCGCAALVAAALGSARLPAASDTLRP